jgi:aminopeptidase N
MKNWLLLIFLFVFAACGNRISESFFDPGVSVDLAVFRKSAISNVRYRLTFEIPETQSETIPGRAGIEFQTTGRIKKPLLLDFNVTDDYLHTLIVNGKSLPCSVSNGHIIIPASDILTGNNIIEITFRTGEQSLNRNPDFLYTLLVPDRASTAFPCFDQPDLKARFELTLILPEDYEAMSNSEIVSVDKSAGSKKICFSESEPISTYLFAFAAGKFERTEETINGVKMEMLHREPVGENVERNREAIFRLHYNSIKWMEEYTGITYPFQKFGFVLIPGFQYGGMEHPGAIFYRASSLFLKESPTINEQMSRASLIAHETSHIWFGDLVTMKWFDDVWLKEVFAGYMSDKMVSPDFPDANHELRFLLSRYPSAYNIDRTTGSNPVIQKLDNLRNAGSLYGGIIYNKAPIVMKHLEQITGDSLMRESLKIYLKRFSYDNAEWDDLISIMEEISGMKLKKWGDAWMREPGMPEIEARIEESTEGGYRIWFSETDPAGRGRRWPQSVNSLIITENERITSRLNPGESSSSVESGSKPLAIIPDINGLAYGYFILDEATAEWMMKSVNEITDPLTRGVMWINAWENLLDNRIDAANLYNTALNSALQEENELLRNYLSGRISALFWNHLDSMARTDFRAESERLVWSKMESCSDPALKRAWFSLFRSIALTTEGLDKLYNIWQNGVLPGEQKLSEEDLCTLALTLALKEHRESSAILDQQLTDIKNPDRKRSFEFVMPSVSDNQDIRDLFFESLADPVNREREPWVLEALGYLHHPLRASSSVKYLHKSLVMLEEIKYTGDIFFPGNWISTTLAGHRSSESWEIVRRFLDERPGYPEDLKLKILQASDHLYRLHEKNSRLKESSLLIFLILENYFYLTSSYPWSLPFCVAGTPSFIHDGIGSPFR